MITAALFLLGTTVAPQPRQLLHWRQAQPVRATASAREVDEGDSIVVGTQRLVRCRIAVPGYCGRLTVPLNWLDPNDGTISIRYQWLPARSASPTGTIVAEEGGPGYSTTGSGFIYRQLFDPLMQDRNLLMMDQRGTGESAPIDCPALQPFGGSGGGTVPFPRAVELCGAQLNRTYRDKAGHAVHASDLFGTNQAVRDLAAILQALGQGPVDYYGDSYGSFFGQIFASRYPAMLRSVVLDSTYPTIHQDPFDKAGQAEIRFGFTVVCARSLACSTQAPPGSPLTRIAALDAALDAHPLDGQTFTPVGTPVRVHMSGPDIWTLLSVAGDDFGPYRNLDAAIRAYLGRSDAAPLLRLDDWTVYGPAFAGYGYKEYSEGMYIADICTVYRNPFGMDHPLLERRMEYARAVAALEPFFGYPLLNADVFASPAEWYNNCITWPAPEQHDPIVTTQPPIVPKTLPVMILSGDLDETTSPGDNEQAADALGPSVTFVSLPNSIHAPALLDPYHCASAIVQNFIRKPAHVGTACTVNIPEVRTVGVFPLTLKDQPPATALIGNTGNEEDLRLAALAVGAVGDTIQAATYAYYGYAANCGNDYCGTGLRGGTYRASPGLDRIALKGIAYSNDTRVSGGVAVGDAFLPGDPGIVRVQNLQARTADGRVRISLDVVYDQREPHALATISGVTSRGERIRARVPAP